MLRPLAVVACLAAAHTVLAQTAHAQANSAAADYPSRPVKVIVAVAPGGGIDTVARILTEHVRVKLGQPFVIENRGGASGLIGTEAAAKSAPDGYTLLFTASTTTIAIPLMRKVNYDYAGLMPIGRMGDVLCGFVINATVGPKTLPELLDYAKKNPGKLAFGSSGNGTTPHLRFEIFKHRAGLDILHVPYRGGADTLTDVLANNVQLMNEPVSLPHVKTGKLRALGVTSAQRSPAAPDIPTIAESGLPGFDAVSWFALFAPANTPKPIVDKWATEVRRVLKLPDVAKRLADNGLDPVGSTPEELAAYQKTEIAKWAKVVKESGAKAD
mgnify:CR=1 FL=1